MTQLRPMLSTISPARLTAIIALAGHLLLTAACAGSPPESEAAGDEARPAAHFFVGETEIFAELVRDRGGSWVFRKLHGSDTGVESGYAVRLNDLTPAFDIRAAECTPQIYPEGHRCSPTHPFRDKDSGVIDKIINSGVAVGTAGKVTEISQKYETTFDETAFNRAVDEALVNSGLENDRRRLIELLDRYDAAYRSTRAELVSLAESFSAADAGAAGIDIDIEPRMLGVVEYFGGDLDMQELVSLERLDRRTPGPIELRHEDILPCEAARCVVEAETALASLRRDADQYREQLRTLSTPENVTYGVRCSNGIQDGYLLATSCPERLVVDGPVAVLPIEITILARDFESLYPPLSLGDERLGIEVDGGRIHFTNRTNEYLSVTAATVYYNSRSHTTVAAIDIPPGISVDRALEEFVSRSIEIESSYRQMTPDRAARTSFRFGLAVRYRSGSSAEERTLHAINAYSAGCVIENRMRPGSCDPGAEAADDATTAAPPPDETRNHRTSGPQ